MLEYLKYYTDVHGSSRSIILAQDSETMASLKWLQALYNIELILWPHLYILMSRISYCALLAQQQCDWAQWDVDEFLHLLDNARLVDYVQDTPSNTHSALFKLHFVQMFANETVLRTPSGGVLRNFQCGIDRMPNFKTLPRSKRSCNLRQQSALLLRKKKGTPLRSYGVPLHTTRFRHGRGAG